MSKNKILVVMTSFLLAVLVLFQNTMEVSAANVYTGLRNYPGKEMQIGSYEYGDRSFSITLPSGKYSVSSTGTLTLDSFECTVQNGDSYVSGTVTNGGSSGFTSDGTSFTVGGSSETYNLTIKGTNDTITINGGNGVLNTTSSGVETYTFTGQYKFDLLYLFQPDRLQLFGVDFAKVWMHNFGWNESLTGVSGTVVSSSYVVDTVGSRHDLIDGSNLFLYELPEGQLAISTVVDFSVVIPATSSSDVTFTVNLAPRTATDTWYAWPLQRYYDYGEVVDALQGGYDNPDAGGAADGLDGSLGGYEDAEGEITGGAIDDLDNFTIDGEGISGYAEALLTVFPLVSAMMQSIFVSSGNLAIIITAGFTLTIVCILLGVAKFHMR